MMNRQRTVAYCNDEIRPLLPIRDQYHFDAVKAARLIERWRVGKPSNVYMHPTVKNGVLSINGEEIGRIADPVQILGPVQFGQPERWTDRNSGAADFWEGRILARQESDWD